MSKIIKFLKKLFGKKIQKTIKPKIVYCFMCHKEKPNDGHTCCEECAGVSF